MIITQELCQNRGGRYLEVIYVVNGLKSTFYFLEGILEAFEVSGF